MEPKEDIFIKKQGNAYNLHKIGWAATKLALTPQKYSRIYCKVNYRLEVRGQCKKRRQFCNEIDRAHGLT